MGISVEAERCSTAGLRRGSLASREMRSGRRGGSDDVRGSASGAMALELAQETVEGARALCLGNEARMGVFKRQPPRRTLAAKAAVYISSAAREEKIETSRAWKPFVLRAPITARR